MRRRHRDVDNARSREADAATTQYVQLDRGASQCADHRTHWRRQELSRVRARKSCMPKGMRVLYRRLPRLLEQLSLARADGTYARLLSKLAKADLLVIDDLGLGSPKEAERHDLLEVLEDRYGKLSTVVTSQLPVAKWHEWIGDPTVADAILDRVVHNAYKLELRGNSRRKEKATPN